MLRTMTGMLHKNYYETLRLEASRVPLGTLKQALPFTLDIPPYGLCEDALRAQLRRRCSPDDAPRNVIDKALEDVLAALLTLRLEQEQEV